MQSVNIGSNQAGQRLDKFLHKYLPEAGNGFLYKMLRKKNITLNGKRAEGSEILRVGDEIRFFFAEETFAKFSGKNLSAEQNSVDGKHTLPVDSQILEYKKAYQVLKGIQILYEDDHILILNKPAGILTQKATPRDLSLNEWLIGYLISENPGLGEELNTFHPSVCNRLDRNTSGIILCGKSLAGLQFLSHCIKDRRVRKFYRTICVGRLTEEAEIEGFLIKDKEKNKVRVISGGNITDTGSAIATRYRPVVFHGNYTLLEVELITGKTHQIRAHLAAAGHPLIGDYKYGDNRINRQLHNQFELSYQLLHAYRIEFPVTEEAAGLAVSGRTFTAPCPELFVRIQSKLQLEES